jgi:hypothetical protein
MRAIDRGFAVGAVGEEVGEDEGVGEEGEERGGGATMMMKIAQEKAR